MKHLVGWAIAIALTPGTGRGQYLPDPEFTRVDYTGPSVTGHADQVLSLFLPDGRAGATPVVSRCSSSSSCRGSSRPSFRTSSTTPMTPFCDWLSIEVSLGGGGFRDDDAEGDPRGTRKSTSATVCSSLRTTPRLRGTRGTVHPYRDVSRPMPEKDAVMIVQFVRHHAAEMGVDSERLAVYGTSAGAMSMMWVAHGPDRPRHLEATPRAGASIDARDDGAPHWWWHLHPGVRSERGRSCHCTIPPSTSRIACTSGSTSRRPPSPKFRTHCKSRRVPGTTRKSIPRPGDEWPTRLPSSPIAYPSAGKRFRFQPWRQLNQEVDIHTSWSGYSWKLAFPSHRLCISNPHAAEGREDFVTYNEHVQARENLAWLHTRLGLVPDDPWFGPRAHTTRAPESASSQG